MYGLGNTPPSLLFTEQDAIYYYSQAQEILFSILIIAFQFGHYFENIHEDGRNFLNKYSPGFYVKKSEDKPKNLSKCLANFLGTWMEPPRNEVFNSNAQKYRLNKMDDVEKYLEIQFESDTKLRIHYWRFNHVIDMLLESNDYFIVGTRINPDDFGTIQGSLYNEAIKNGYAYANLRIASYVCDLIVVCGYAEYGYTKNPKSGRTVQGIRKTTKLSKK